MGGGPPNPGGLGAPAPATATPDCLRRMIITMAITMPATTTTPTIPPTIAPVELLDPEVDDPEPPEPPEPGRAFS